MPTTVGEYILDCVLRVDRLEEQVKALLENIVVLESKIDKLRKPKEKSASA